MEYGLKSVKEGLDEIGLKKVKKAYWNLSPSELIEIALQNRESQLSNNGALMCDTGRFTGRSPKDRYIVKDELTKDSVWWGNINIPMTGDCFDRLHAKMIGYLTEKTVYVRDAYAGADKTYRINLRVINTVAWHNLFCYNMFIFVIKFVKFDKIFRIFFQNS